MKRKWLGIPMPIVVPILALLVAGSGALAAVMLTQEVPARVGIIVPWMMSVWEEEACETPLVELDFGDIAADTDTDVLTFWLKNDGDNDFYIAMSQVGLAGTHVALGWDGVEGICPPDGFIFPVGIGWVDTGQTVKDQIEPSNTEWDVVDGSVFLDGDIIRLGEEIMLLVSVSGNHLTAERGYQGTTPATHTVGTPYYLLEGEPQTPLASDASMPIALYLSADSDAERGEVIFTVIVNASDLPY